MTHVPVMLEEVLRFLEPKDRGLYLDGTVGLGGHAEAILSASRPQGRLLGIDRDPRNLEFAQARLKPFGDMVMLARGSYAQARQLAEKNKLVGFNGILLDLGFSSAHISDASRGFAFSQLGPLDMRYDQEQELSAAVIINGWPKDDLAEIFRQYGEEPRAAYLADVIIEARRKERILTTSALADLIAGAVGRRGPTHPATKVFQALRIAVNDELGELTRALPELVSLLAPGGTLAIISFQSLEDRIVKQFFKQQEGQTLEILTKKVMVPTDAECEANPRARSAKLRVARRLDSDYDGRRDEQLFTDQVLPRGVDPVTPRRV